MPRRAWRGYERFCPLARALDVVGERWSLVIVQELQKHSMRYGELQRRLPGIGTSVLADRLRKLETAGVLRRRAGPVGESTRYELTERGRSLEPALLALREWGSEFLFDPSADGSSAQSFDLRYVDGVEQIPDGEFQVTVDSRQTTLTFSRGELEQRLGATASPALSIDTSRDFLTRWAAGAVDWETGVQDGDVRVKGPRGAWVHWLAASGYLTRYPPDGEDQSDGR